MDAQTFDRLIAAAARRPTRRATLRLLAGAMLGAWLAQRGGAPARAAQRLDSDQDGLFDDDETNVYGTLPDVSDTDGDGVGDGEEIYNRDNGLGGPSDPHTPDSGQTSCPAGLTDCGGSCVDLLSDTFHCGDCDVFCDNIIGPICVNGVCTGEPNLPRLGCSAGMTDCGGICVDIMNDRGHCGACGKRCGTTTMGRQLACMDGLCELGF